MEGQLLIWKDGALKKNVNSKESTCKVSGPNTGREYVAILALNKKKIKVFEDKSLVNCTVKICAVFVRSKRSAKPDCWMIQAVCHSGLWPKPQSNDFTRTHLQKTPSWYWQPTKRSPNMVNTAEIQWGHSLSSNQSRACIFLADKWIIAGGYLKW